MTPYNKMTSETQGFNPEMNEVLQGLSIFDYMQYLY